MRDMTKTILVAALLVVFGTILMVTQNTTEDVKTNFDDRHTTADIMNTNGRIIGEVWILTPDDSTTNTLQISATIKGGLTPGFHGFHIHEFGKCELGLESPFASAGGHFNPGGTTHGHHAGDLPSLSVLDEGTAALVYNTDAILIEDLLDGDGSAFIIHSGADNFANIPERYGGPDETTLSAGDAGSRVACGVIKEYIPEIIGG